MKSLVVYDSVFGNTKKIAKAIKSGLEAKTSSKLIHAEDIKPVHLKDLDLLVVGSPTHGGWFMESVKDFIQSIPEDDFKKLQVASFDTSMPKNGNGFFVNLITKIFGNAAPRILHNFEKRGAEVIDSAVFLVIGKEGPLKEGEEARAKEWAEDLI
jgi:flavodoxin